MTNPVEPVAHTWPTRWFEAYGLELEYMVVDRDSLDVRPLTDQVIHAQSGTYESEIDVGEIAWSNELVLHVVELKTLDPRPDLEALPAVFQDGVDHVNRILAPMNAMLMPTGMHPWMDPLRETRLWPHEYNPVYETFDRIFDCRGHGWANLQSLHLNLPFGDDREFGRLHAAIRLVLPIIPALAASTPVVDGRPSGWLDTRLEHYRRNAAKVPSVSGRVIPEPVFTRADYEGRLLQSIYDDLAPFDPDGVLRYEWVNARGCIARFDRGAIEVRVLDMSECPRADAAVSLAVIGAVQALAEERFAGAEAQRGWPVEPLADLFEKVIVDGERTMIEDRRYLEMFGWKGRVPCQVRDLWAHLMEAAIPSEPRWRDLREALELIVDEGPLARRISHRLGDAPDRERLREVYRELCRCLAAGEMLR